MAPNVLENRPHSADTGALPDERGDAHARLLAPELAEIAEAARFPEENPNPVFRVAADGRLLYANRASRPLLATWGVDDGGCVPPPWRNRITEVLAGGQPRKWDAECGDQLLQLHYVPILISGYVNVYGADVTERVTALQAGRASDAKYRLLFDSIDVAFCIIEVLFDESGKPVDYVFLEANPAFERQTGLVDAIGRRMRDLAPLHEEYWFQIYGKIALTGEPARFENAAAQFGRYYDLYAFRIGDPAERKVAVLFSDITSRKQAEAERDRLWREVEARNRELEAQAEQIRTLNAGLEQRVLERTAELEAIFASIPDALYVADESGVLRCNRAVLDAFGCETVDELNEKRRQLVSQMSPRYAGTGQSIPHAELERGPRRRGERAVVEMTIRHQATQQDRTYRVAAAPVPLHGQTVAFVAHATDITEQKRTELELAYQANLLANVSDAVIATDLDHRITSLNRAAEEMFGWTIAEARGRPIEEVLPSRFIKTSVAEVYRELAEEGRWRGEMIVTCRDGRELHVDASRMPVRDARGQVIGQVGVKRDITAQKQARAQIDHMADLLENVNDAIFAYDVNMRITAWNKRAAELYGWSAAEAIGAYGPDIVGSRLTVDQRDAAMRHIAEIGRWQGQAMHTRRDGTPIIIEATAMRLCDETGRVNGYVTVNRDITERKRMEDELKARREELEGLSRRLVTMQESERSYVADQLYNQAGQVLAALQMQLSRLGREDGREGPAEQLPRMQAMLQEAIGELHDLAKELRPAGLDRSSLARVLGTYVTEFGKSHGLAVQFRPGTAEALRVPADVGTAIFRSVQEGLTNVARHARASEVVLSLAVEGDDLVVTLTDNGVGFGAGVAFGEDGRELRAAMGQPGWLGLASIRERLEIIGGHLTILSGKSGTTLTMTAPIVGR